MIAETHCVSCVSDDRYMFSTENISIVTIIKTSSLLESVDTYRILQTEYVLEQW